jgi:heptose I phosphotransferase
VTRRQEVVPNWRERLADSGLDDLTRLLDTPTGVPSRVGHWQPLSKPGLQGRQRWRWDLADGSGTVLYAKCYRHVPWREQWDRIRRQTVRHSRAWWEFRQSDYLSRHFIPVVRAIAAVEDMRGTLDVSSAVLFESVPGDAFDRTWTRLCAADAPVTRGAARHDVTRRLARFVSAFHQSGVCHRDLYLCHIFVELETGARPPRFTLIDLARTHRPRLRRTRWLIKDLSQVDASARQIGASRTDRWRFLLTYLGLHAGTPRVRWYARRIARKSDRILARLARQARQRSEPEAPARGPSSEPRAGASGR